MNGPANEPAANDGVKVGLALCGGKSRRMGRDKAGLPFGGWTLLEQVVDVLRRSTDLVLVSAAVGQTLPRLPADVHVVHDLTPDQGPLGGLSAGLAAAPSSSAVLAWPCDAPFLTPEVAGFLLGRLAKSDRLAAAPWIAGHWHPLTAVYRPSASPVLQALLSAGELRAGGLLDRLPAERILEAELRSVDPELRCLTNLNSLDDYEAL